MECFWTQWVLIFLLLLVDFFFPRHFTELSYEIQQSLSRIFWPPRICFYRERVLFANRDNFLITNLHPLAFLFCSNGYSWKFQTQFQNSPSHELTPLCVPLHGWSRHPWNGSIESSRRSALTRVSSLAHSGFSLNPELKWRIWQCCLWWLRGVS